MWGDKVLRCENVLRWKNVLRCENVLWSQNVLRCQNLLRCQIVLKKMNQCWDMVKIGWRCKIIVGKPWTHVTLMYKCLAEWLCWLFDTYMVQLISEYH